MGESRSWDDLVNAGRVIVSGQGWALGDLACEVETAYGESSLMKFADEIGVNYSTLRSYKAAARAWPESVGRPTSLGVAEALAAQEARYELVATEPAMTVARAREIVQERSRERLAAAYRDRLGHDPWENDGDICAICDDDPCSCDDDEEEDGGSSTGGYRSFPSSRESNKPEPSKKQGAAERSHVVQNNKLWREATARRIDFVRHLVAGDTLPEGGLRFILGALCSADRALGHSFFERHYGTRPVLGLPQCEQPHHSVTAIAELLDQASDARAQVIALGIVLGAAEAAIKIETWRAAGTCYWFGGQYGSRSIQKDETERVAAYFRALVAWGYTLSPIEQCVVDGTPVPDADECDLQAAA